jgi:hypothetical protein
MARFKENDLPKSKITASSLKTTLIFKYADNILVDVYFRIGTGATALAFLNVD